MMARLIQCPGSVALIASIPEEQRTRDTADDETADQGTRIHRARELLSDNDLSEEEITIYKQGVDYERQLVERWLSDKGLFVGDIVEGRREERLWLYDSMLNQIASGQPDVYYVAPGKRCALVIDWKGLYATHVPKTNQSAQLRLQALLLWQNRDDIDQIRVAYDRAMLKASVSVNDFTDYTLEDLKYSLQLVEYHLWLSRQPEAQRTPGPECRYCEARAFCREGAAWSLLPSVELRQDGKASVLAPDPEELVAKMTPDDLVKMWKMRPLVGQILKMSVERLKSLPDEQLFALGLERSKGRKLDPLVDTVGAWKYLESKGWTEEERLKCMEFSKTAIGEEIGRREGIAEKYQSERVSQEFDPFIERKQAEPGLRLFKGIK